jgi:hypothetical protein
MKLVQRVVSSVVLGCLVAGPAAAQAQASAPVAANERMLVEQGFGGFLDAHPDLRHHKRGLAAFLAGDHVKAMRAFRLAARFGDKPSQALIAEMLWEGKGTAADRPLAYAWMDLAAERGDRRMLLQREHYWAQLDEAQRTQAVERGAALYAEFGDAVAKRRMELELRRASRKFAGTRTGFAGNTTIVAAAVGAGAAPVTVQTADGAAMTQFSSVQPTQSLAAQQFFAPTYWSPDTYFAWRDGYWERKLQSGTVEVGEIAQGDATRSEPMPPVDED